MKSNPLVSILINNYNKKYFCVEALKSAIKQSYKKIESKCGWSPFDGYKFKGTPVVTIINGKVKMKDGKIIGEPDGTPMKFK